MNAIYADEDQHNQEARTRYGVKKGWEKGAEPRATSVSRHQRSIANERSRCEASNRETTTEDEERAHALNRWRCVAMR